MIIKMLFNTTETMLKDRGLEPTGRVQKIVDSEVLRRSDPYVPFKTGYLKSSGIRGTKIGSGEVMYNAVYAHTNYYLNAGRGKQGTVSGGLRGKFWFERMKADHLDDILKTAKEKKRRKIKIMETSIIKSLFRWFADCDVLEVDNDLNVDYLGEDPEQYSIEVVPCKTVLKQYIDGSAKCQYLFIFASRESYSSDESINMANLEFYERLEEWIAEQDLNGKLPKLPEGLTPLSVKVLSSGYAIDNDTKSARYQIQCQLKYMKTIGGKK